MPGHAARNRLLLSGTLRAVVVVLALPQLACCLPGDPAPHAVAAPAHCWLSMGRDGRKCVCE